MRASELSLTKQSVLEPLMSGPSHLQTSRQLQRGTVQKEAKTAEQEGGTFIDLTFEE